MELNPLYCAIGVLTGDACQTAFPLIPNAGRIELTTKLVESQHGDLLLVAGLSQWMSSLGMPDENNAASVESGEPDSDASHLTPIHRLSNLTGIECDVYEVHPVNEGAEDAEVYRQNFSNLS